MNVQQFSLRPFDSAIDSAKIKLSGCIARSDHRLNLCFDLFDRDSQVLIPSVNSPQRQHDLWKTTCFEFFIAIQNRSQYWEFNLSPSSDWNVYRFSDYRTGMQEESAVTSLPFEIETRSHQILLTIELDLNVINANQPLDVGITAVIEQRNRSISYWAIEHCGTEADFHLRDSFVLNI